MSKAQIPNILTIGRILTIPLLVAGILQVGSGSPSFLGSATAVISLFLLACFTDYLDGFLARKWEVTSDFGRMIDPIADKLLVAACLIAISIALGGDWLILAPALAIIGRDILVSGAREHAALKSMAMPPTQLAKWKTAFEMLAIAVLLIYLCLPAYPASGTVMSVGAAILWIAAALSVYTGSLYFRASLKD